MLKFIVGLFSGSILCVTTIYLIKIIKNRH